jgi:PAS domain S-box-containing protein
MKIQKRLKLGRWLALCAIVIIAGFLVLSFQELNRADENLTLTDNMRKIAFERVSLRDEYMLLNSERARTQWFSKTDALRNLVPVAAKVFQSPEEKALIADIQSSLDSTADIVAQIERNRKQAQDSENKWSISPELEKRLFSQLVLKAFILTGSIGRLHESTYKTMLTVQNRSMFILAFFIILISALIFANNFFINRLLLHRITKLQEGTDIIGSGNLDFRFNIQGDDELVALARTSDQMTARLQASHTSIDNLQAEIIERKKMEGELRQSEMKFRIVADNTYDWEHWKSGDGHYIYVSPSCKRITGYGPEEFLADANLMKDIIFPEDAVIYETHIKDDVARRHSGEIEYRIRTKDGAIRWIGHVCQPVFDNKGDNMGVRGSNRDITERKRAEQALNKTLTDLERSNKELEQFAYIASHDLQEPLRTISSYVQLIAKRYKGRLDQDADDFISFAVEGALRMQKMISDLLEYSRVGTRAKPPALVGLDDILNEALANLQVKIENAGATITHGPLPVVKADASQLLMLFQNLIENAMKFCGVKPPEIHIAAEKHGDESIISVRDNGIGFEQQYADKIFEIFKRLHGQAKYPGSGIGLAICRRIVERHGGRIWAESSPGEGAIFYFTLPQKGATA